MAGIKGLGEVPKDVAPIIKALEPLTYGGRRADQSFEDWLYVVDGTLTMMPRHLQSVQATGRPAADTPEVAEVWARLRKLYRPEDFEHFRRAFHALLDAAYEPGGRPTFRDLLGEIYMAWGWPSAGLGQYFSPGPVAKMMADMTSNGSAAVYEHLAAAIERSPEARTALLALAADQAGEPHLSGNGHNGHNGNGHGDLGEIGDPDASDGQAIAAAAVLAGGTASGDVGSNTVEDPRDAESRDAESRDAGSTTASAAILAAMRQVLKRDAFWEQVAPLALPWYVPVKVCDPACGSGVMLLAYASTCEPWMLAGGFVEFYGTDLDSTCALMAKIALKLYGLDTSNLSSLNTLTRREMAALPAHYQAAYLEAQEARRRGDLERVRAIAAALRAGTYAGEVPEMPLAPEETRPAELYERLCALLREVGAPLEEHAESAEEDEPVAEDALMLAPVEPVEVELTAEAAPAPGARSETASTARRAKKTAKTPPRSRPRQPGAGRQLPLAGA